MKKSQQMLLHFVVGKSFVTFKRHIASCVHLKLLKQDLFSAFTNEWLIVERFWTRRTRNKSMFIVRMKSCQLLPSLFFLFFQFNFRRSAFRSLKKVILSNFEKNWDSYVLVHLVRTVHFLYDLFNHDLLYPITDLV